MHVIADYETPADLAIENEEGDNQGNAYREAARRMVTIMNRFVIFVTQAENSKLAAWQASIAMGFECCAGVSYEDVARMCGVGILSPTKGRAAVSKGVKEFQAKNSLPPSFYMKSQDASRAYKQARTESINERNRSLASRAG